jgi:hypothetical protein
VAVNILVSRVENQLRTVAGKLLNQGCKSNLMAMVSDSLKSLVYFRDDVIKIGSNRRRKSEK